MSNDGNFGANSTLFLRCNTCGERWPTGVVVTTSGNPGCCWSPNIHIWNEEHRWKGGWPGNFCLDCGIEDPIEAAMLDDPDFFETCPRCLGVEIVAATCDECKGTGCIVNTSNVEVPPCPGPPK